MFFCYNNYKGASHQMRPGVEMMDVYKDRFNINYFVNTTFKDENKLEYICNLIYEFFRDGNLAVEKLRGIMISNDSTILYDKYNNSESSILVFNVNDDQNKIKEILTNFCKKQDLKKK